MRRPLQPRRTFWPTSSPPRPPPACDSESMQAQIAEVRNCPRSAAAFNSNSRAMYWQSPEGINTWPYVYASKWMFEDQLNQNAPRAARAYALLASVYYDAYIA